ncbi:CoA transferase [Streptomyces sp. NPDC002845]
MAGVGPDVIKMDGLRDPDGPIANRESAARADVVIENRKPRGPHHFGLDHETADADNPAVGYASMSGFGAGQGAPIPDDGETAPLDSTARPCACSAAPTTS